MELPYGCLGSIKNTIPLALGLRDGIFDATPWNEKKS